MSVHQLKSDPHFESVGQAAAGVVDKAAQARTAYTYWNEALILGSGRELTREQMKLLGVTHEPQSGFYRKRNKGGKDAAVAIWNDEMGIVALVDGEPADPVDIWTHVCRWPVSHEQYEAVADRGEPWPDDAPVAEASIGHNMPSDPHEAAKIEFEGLKEAALELRGKPVRDQDDADRRAVLSKALSDIFNKVDRLFRAKKDPIVQAAHETDEEFRWRMDAKDLSKGLKKDSTDYLLEQERLEQERQRKAAQEAERIRREAEEAARKAAESDQQSEKEREAARQEAERKAAEAAAAEREAQARKVSAGRTGAKVSLRTYVSARVVDYDKAVEALKTHPDMKALVEQLANRAVKAGVAVDGVERLEEKRAA